MDTFSQIVQIPGFTVSDVEIDETALHLDLKHDSDTCVCPRCGVLSRAIRHSYWRGVRDLPISGRICYVYVLKRYFDCAICQQTFAEPFGFVAPNREYTLRYEESIFERVRHTTASYVADCEGLTDKVVTRIFLRQAQQRLPAEPFKGVKKLGIDEIAERKGRQAYDLVFYNLETGTPIEVLENRTKAELVAYLKALSPQVTRHIEEVCIDMWRPYATAVTEQLSHATLVTDRFHVMKAVNDDLNTLKKQVKPTLPEEAKACHYPLLKNHEELTDRQQEILDHVYAASPQLKAAHELKETFRDIFEHDYTVSQGRRELQGWLDKARHTKLFPEAVKTITNWFDSIVNYFRNRTTNGPAEGVNNKIKVIKRMAYGFRNFANFRLRILAAFL